MRIDRSAVLAGLIAAVIALAANLPWVGRGELESEEARRALPTASFLDRLAADDADVDGALATWAVPRVFGRAYLAKPPAFYWWSAAHQVALERTGLDAALRPAERTDAGWWPAARRGSPVAIRLAALSSAALLAALVAVLASLAQGRRRAVVASASTSERTSATALGIGVAAGAMVVAAPSMLSKASLGELESTFALTCAVAALALLRAATKPGPFIALVAASAIGLACLTKGPLALLFSAVPAFTCAVARIGVRPALRRLALPIALGVGLFAWWPFFVRGVVEPNDAREGVDAARDVTASWLAELWRGGTGGFVTYLKDRWRLVTGVLGGWAPASLLALGIFSARRRAQWRTEGATHLALHVVFWGLLVLLVWPGVRPRYALPLLPFVVLLAAQRLGSGGFPRAPRLIAGVLAFAAVAIGPVAFWLVGRAAEAGSSDFAEPAVAAIGSAEWLAIALSATVGTAVLVRLRHLGPRGLLVAAVACLVAGRAVELGPIERTRTSSLRVSAAAHVEATCRALGQERLHLDTWTYFNDLYYTDLDVRWCTHTAGLPAGSLVLSRGADPQREASAGWERIPLFEGSSWRFAPLPPRAFGREGTDGGARLWRRTAAVEPVSAEPPSDGR
ncbi:hypothetical protein Pla163_07180 [Planctomycetes bacterium Pla163]|uniref:Glycosyltransferase RgtA/B/C/D-like domain-containing protein n=1 Tax=Rohdeia mirabilis TaxID=2528008 RepID=A0A518CWN0_9BACT|nr:hypothetical protein Pla163_07180 [Planctomycetes bacterium Pla163]